MKERRPILLRACDNGEVKTLCEALTAKPVCKDACEQLNKYATKQQITEATGGMKPNVLKVLLPILKGSILPEAAFLEHEMTANDWNVYGFEFFARTVRPARTYRKSPDY